MHFRNCVTRVCTAWNVLFQSSSAASCPSLSAVMQVPFNGEYMMRSASLSKGSAGGVAVGLSGVISILGPVDLSLHSTRPLNQHKLAGKGMLASHNAYSLYWKCSLNWQCKICIMFRLRPAWLSRASVQLSVFSQLTHPHPPNKLVGVMLGSCTAWRAVQWSLLTKFYTSTQPAKSPIAQDLRATNETRSGEFEDA